MCVRILSELTLTDAAGNMRHRTLCVGLVIDDAVCADLPQVDQLRGEVARYQARLAELENDFLSLDVVANTEVSINFAEQHGAACRLSYILAEQLWPAPCVSQHHSSWGTHINVLLSWAHKSGPS